LRIAVQFNADRKQLIDPTPEPTGGSYGLRQWDVAAAKQKLLVEGVFQDIWGRWWIDRASDVLFLVLGLLVGVHQGQRRSANTGKSP
jgi:hypothetical protein